MSKLLLPITPLGAGVTHSLDTVEPEGRCAGCDLGLHLGSTIYVCCMTLSKLLTSLGLCSPSRKLGTIRVPASQGFMGIEWKLKKLMSTQSKVTSSSRYSSDVTLYY